MRMQMRELRTFILHSLGMPLMPIIIAERHLRAKIHDTMKKVATEEEEGVGIDHIHPLLHNQHVQNGLHT